MALSMRAMAAELGVSKSQVARDAQAGMPMTDAAAARAWRLAQHDMSRTVDGRIDRETPAAPEQPKADADEPTAGDTSEYRQARATRERVNAERAQIELDQLRGRLIDLADAKRLAFTAFRSIRDAVMNVPARVAAQCAVETDAMRIEQLIEADLTAALTRFDPEKLLSESNDDDDETG